MKLSLRNSSRVVLPLLAIFASGEAAWAQLGTRLDPEQITPTLADVALEAPTATPLPTPHRVDGPLEDEIFEELIAPIERPVFGDWLGYNSQQSDTSWVANDEFGMFSLESYPNLRIDQDSALSLGTGFHFLNGPHAPDMPPRLFDFQMAYQTRRIRSESFILDLKLSVGAYSDFEGSARDGIRFPGHAVLYNSINPRVVSVLGVEVLDRDDISVLPVGGFVYRPNDRFIYELVFPRPRIQARITASHTAYVAGELGGSTWAVERGELDDNATYHDLRMFVGLMDFSGDSALELGWAFDRSLEFRSGDGNSDFEDAVILRFRTHF